MRTQVRIVAGTLRGRRVVCEVDTNLRPTPQMVREALFSVLGNAVPDRPFFDVFAGTGVVGLEAISRGASSTIFVERDFRLVSNLERHAKQFQVEGKVQIVRTDVYRWAERWQPPAEPITVFLSPPFVDFQRRPQELLKLLADLQGRLADGSVLVLQGEHEATLGVLPDAASWDDRRYGRNHLYFWVRDVDRSNPEARNGEPAPES